MRGRDRRGLAPHAVRDAPNKLAALPPRRSPPVRHVVGESSERLVAQVSHACANRAYEFELISRVLMCGDTRQDLDKIVGACDSRTLIVIYNLAITRSCTVNIQTARLARL